MKTNRLVLVWLLALMVSEPVIAHAPIKGIGSFYNGLLHPILVPAHLFLLVAIGLFLGQQGLKKVEQLLGVFASATLVGFIAAWFSSGSETETLVLVLSATLGIMIAISPQASFLWCTAMAFLAGLFLGLDSAQEELAGKEKFLSLFGSGVAIYFLFLYSLAMAKSFNNKNWQKIAIRIVGSWIAASSLLVLALSLSTKS